MATYAIGDLQGCRVEFEALLKLIRFSAGDVLWLLGDLINRGADSLGTMKLVMEMDAQVVTVLGNHDLHFLAIYFGGHKPSSSDTFDELLASKHAASVAEWLCEQKLYHSDEQLGYVMTHAGIPPQWSLTKCESLAREVEGTIRGENPAVSRGDFFREMYGNKPTLWEESLTGMSRLRLITNYLTRMRLIDNEYALDFDHKGALEAAPEGWTPWFDAKPLRELPLKILFGHWAALDGYTGQPHCIALDTGCVWGRKLSALRLEDGELFQVSAQS